MITEVKAYSDSLGQLHPNIESAQKAELRDLLKHVDTTVCIGVVVDALFKDAEKLKEILFNPIKAPLTT